VDVHFGSATTWLEEQYTDPNLIEVLLIYLDSWRNDLPFTPPAADFIKLVNSQTAIGWNGPFEGWFSVHWSVVQQDCLSSIRSCRSGRRWLISLIKKLWDVSWDFWAHRNGVVHKHGQTLPAKDLVQLDRSVVCTYQDLLQCCVSRPIRQLTFLPLRNILAKDVHYKTVWLQQAIVMVHNTQLGDHPSLLQMRRCLEAWLRRSRNLVTM
jgi:hypothetical protein